MSTMEVPSASASAQLVSAAKPPQGPPGGPTPPMPTDKKKRHRKALSCRPCRHKKLRCDRARPCGSCVRRHQAAECAYMESSNLSESSQRRGSSVPSAEENIVRKLDRIHEKLCHHANIDQPSNDPIPSIRGTIPQPLANYLTQKLVAIEEALSRITSGGQEGDTDMEEPESDESDAEVLPESSPMEDRKPSPIILRGEHSAMGGLAPFHTMTGAVDRTGEDFGISQGVPHGMTQGLQHDMTNMHIEDPHYSQIDSYGVVQDHHTSWQIGMFNASPEYEQPPTPASLHSPHAHLSPQTQQPHQPHQAHQSLQPHQPHQSHQHQRGHSLSEVSQPRYRSLLPAASSSSAVPQVQQTFHHQPYAQPQQPQPQYSADLGMRQTATQPRKQTQDDSYEDPRRKAHRTK